MVWLILVVIAYTQFSGVESTLRAQYRREYFLIVDTMNRVFREYLVVYEYSIWVYIDSVY